MRLGFPDVVFPGDKRNEVYVKLWSGDFSAIHTHNSRLSMAGLTRGGMGPPGSNIEVIAEVRDGSGHTIDAPVISMGSGEPSSNRFHSMIFQRNNQPTFGELFKINLPSSDAPQWHLFFLFFNRAAKDGRPSNRGADQDKPFAFAFLPLFPQDRTFLEDGGHTLVLYRADRLANITPDLYRSATPWLSQGQRPEQINVPPEMQRSAPPLRDTVSLRTSLCSTRFTQDPILFTLLTWRQVADETLLSTILSKFIFVTETEIVKFLGDIFDALFGILVSGQNQRGSMDHLVLNGLVTVLGIVQDRRFRNFLPVLDVYIDKHFNHPLAGLRLINSMNRLLAEPSADTASSLRAALKVWNYLFKFTGRSLELQRSNVVQNGGSVDEINSQYRDAFSAHLREINQMMGTTTPAAIIGTQTIALQHFTSILHEVAKVFPPDELVDIAMAFIHANRSVKGKIVIWKLITLLHLVKGFLFDDAKSRARLVEEAVVWIKPHFGRFDEYAQAQEGENAIDNARISWLESTRLCITIVAVLLDKLQECLINPKIGSDPKALRKEHDNVELIIPLLPK
jgi:dedicator of cytokinesis protein 3